MATLPIQKTAVALAVAATFTIGAIPEAEANVLTLSWRGAFTFLNPGGQPLVNSVSDYELGYYGNGDGNAGTFGTPYYPVNVGPNALLGPYPNGAIGTGYAWYGNRTPVSGTISFDTSTGAGVGTVNPFFFFGDTPGGGGGTSILSFLNPTFQVADTIGTIVGTMLMSWSGGGHSISIVLDGAGLFGSLPVASSTVISGVGTLPATDGLTFGSAKNPISLPLGPSPVATKTQNALGCEGQSLATQVNAFIINPTGNIANCNLSQDDGIGGSPMVSSAFPSYNVNLDITSLHFSFIPPPPPVPIPAAVWLFGSGLVGLVGMARRNKRIH